MARTKQRENYGNGSVTPEMMDKPGKDGQPVRVQRKDGKGRLCWRVCINLGTETYIDKNSKARKRRRKVQRTVYGTLDDARSVAKQLTVDYEHIDLESDVVTFSDACDAWAKSMRDNDTCAPSKLKDYETRLSYVCAHLGDKPLAEITTSDLEKALAAVKVERGQSQRTYRDSKRHVKRVFKYARKQHWIVFDPSEDLEAVSVRGRVERRSLDASEFARLRSCIDRDIQSAIDDFEQKEQRQFDWGNGYTRTSIKGLANISCMVGIRILCSTGCRRGEMLALTWDKLDFPTGSMTIDKSLNSDAVLKEPKTEAGIRTIAIDADTMAFLGRWKAFQKKVLHLVMADDGRGSKKPANQTEKTPIVCSCVGSFLDPHNLERWWCGSNGKDGYRDKIEFPGLKLHELRHTSATLLLGNGMPVIDVAARLGHDDVAVTLNTYGHAIKAHDKMAADLIGSLMSPATAPAAQVLAMDSKTA